MNRRQFLRGAGLGAAGLTAAGMYATRYLPSGTPPPPAAAPPLAMPGTYAGRVVEAHRSGSVRPDWTVDRESIRMMMDRGMTELTGADHPIEGWRRFFEKGDIVGIKVNPVGYSRSNKPVSVVSKPEIVWEIVRNLKEVGLPAQDIIIFERYGQEFVDAGYAKFVESELDGCRWYASAVHYTDTQLAITGFDQGRGKYSPELARHIVGYDPDQFVHMGFASNAHDPKDDRRHRSHLSLIVTKLVNKFITIPNLKDHRSAGVTVALKNMSHGLNNNVARSHLSGVAHGFFGSPGHDVTGPNQCNTFIPAAVNQLPIRQKATLHILDGLIGVYEGGPGVWNRTWGVWPHESLFFATDPVAMDHVAWDIIDARRVAEGWPRCGDMGKHLFSAARQTALHLGGLRGPDLFGSLTGLAAGLHLQGGGATEAFDRRQPEHVALAGLIGLGKFDPAEIAHRRVNL